MQRYELKLKKSMKMVDFLRIFGPALKTLSENEVCRDDWRYVGVYDEFMQMRELGVKYDEAVRMLADDYGIGRATVERVVARLGREVRVRDSDDRTYRADKPNRANMTYRANKQNKPYWDGRRCGGDG